MDNFTAASDDKAGKRKQPSAPMPVQDFLDKGIGKGMATRERMKPLGKRTAKALGMM